jgi:hypothetical protein
MKNLINWIYNNLALAVIFGIEGLILVCGFVWVIAFTFEDNDQRTVNQPVIEQNLTVIEIEDFIFDKVYDCLELKDPNLNSTKKIVKNNIDVSISNFINKNSDILILSRELDKIELNQISKDRLPVSQISISCDSVIDARNSVFIIKDNYHNNSLFDIAKAKQSHKFDNNRSRVLKNS